MHCWVLYKSELVVTYTNKHVMLGKCLFVPSVVADYNRRCKQIRDDVCTCGYDARALFALLLNTSQFEFVMKEVSQNSYILTYMHCVAAASWRYLRLRILQFDLR